MKTLSLSLPYPPSVNSYWMSLRRGPLAGRVIISQKGKEYRKHVVGAGLVPMGWNNGARMGVSITAHAPDRRKRDIDNILKSLLDSLQHAGVFADDSQVDEIRIMRGPIIKEGMVDVVIHQLEAPALT